jgi:hypothetical protein
MSSIVPGWHASVLLREHGTTVLVLEDAGGAPLDRMLEAPMTLIRIRAGAGRGSQLLGARWQGARRAQRFGCRQG